MNSTAPANPLQTLRTSLPGLQITTEPAVLHSHGQDWTRFRDPAPLAVAFPGSVKEVQELVRIASGTKLGLVPSGGRTGLSGGALAANGELVVSFDRMRKILDFSSPVVNQRSCTPSGVRHQARNG